MMRMLGLLWIVLSFVLGSPSSYGTDLVESDAVIMSIAGDPQDGHCG